VSQREQVVSGDDDESFAKLSTSQETGTGDAVKVGVRWNTCSDTISFDFSELQDYANLLPITKRSLLKVVAKILDPLVCFLCSR
jgi:hypothetical protein